MGEDSVVFTPIFRNDDNHGDGCVIEAVVVVVLTAAAVISIHHHRPEDNGLPIWSRLNDGTKTNTPNSLSLIHI